MSYEGPKSDWTYVHERDGDAAKDGAFDVTPVPLASKRESVAGEPDNTASEATLPASLEGALMNQAWDEVEAADAKSEPLSVEHYSPEEAHALIEALDEIHAKNEPLVLQEDQRIAVDEQEENATPQAVSPLVEQYPNVFGPGKINQPRSEVAESTEGSVEDAASAYVFNTVDSKSGYSVENPTHVFTGDERAKAHELLDLLKQQSNEQEKSKLFAQLQHFVETGRELPATSSEEIAAERESGIDQVLVRSSAATARADIEIAFGNDSHDIVMSARSQHERLMELLHNPPELEVEQEQAEAQAKWEKSVSGVLNVLQNLRDTYVKETDDGFQKINAGDPMDAAMPNVYALRPELAEKRRAEIMAFGEVQDTAFAEEATPIVVEPMSTQPITSLEDAFSDPSATEWEEDVSDNTPIYDTSFAQVAQARGAALKKGYKASGVPLGYDPKAPRPAAAQTPPRKGFFKRLFGG